MPRVNRNVEPALSGVCPLGRLAPHEGVAPHDGNQGVVLFVGAVLEQHDALIRLALRTPG